MKNSWFIALRELYERLSNRSFRWMLFIGPLLVLLAVFVLVETSQQGVESMKVLVADPANILDGKITAHPSQQLEYDFYNEYLDHEAFKNDARFNGYDALIEVNHKVLDNKTVRIFYREQPSFNLKTTMRFDLEGRVEEVMLDQFSTMNSNEFRKIKQKLNVRFMDVDDPLNTSEEETAWVGYFLGYLMLFFVGFFGINITRSINREKTNRISEVLLSSVRPNELMMGKILGNLLSSLLQLIFWVFLIGIGLWVFKEFFFQDYFIPDYLNQTQVDEQQMSSLGMKSTFQENMSLELLYYRINYPFVILNFGCFFLGTYWVYSSLFTVLGALSGDESDGQQFSLPIWIFIFLGIYAGYYALSYPNSEWTTFFSYFPWTSGMVAMVKICSGVSTLAYSLLFVAFAVQLFVGSLLVFMAGKVFKQGILSNNHRVSFKLLRSWLRKN